MTPQITVGVCVRNAQNTITETIQSMLAQDYPADLMEMIIVDGDSEDATLPIVTRLLSKTRVRWRLCSDDGKGLGYARQIIVNLARGRYIVFVSDVVIQRDFFRRQIEFMTIHPRVAVVAGRFMYKDMGNWLSNIWNLYSSAFAGKMGSIWVCRTDALRSVGGFDEAIRGASEDSDILARLKSSGWSSAANERAKFFHNSRQTLTSFWSHHAWYGYGGYYFARKHRGLARPWGDLPPGRLIEGLRLAPRAYRSTRRKVIFLILPLLIFASMAWSFGFVRAAIHRYGPPN